MLLDEQEEGCLFHKPQQEHRQQTIRLRSILPGTRADLGSKVKPEDDQDSREEEVQPDDKPCICKGSQVDQQNVREVTQEKQECSHLHPLPIAVPPAIRTLAVLCLIR